MNFLTSQVEDTIRCSPLGHNRLQWCLIFLSGMFILASTIQSEAKVVVAAASIQIFTLANTQYPEPHRTKVDEPVLCLNEYHHIIKFAESRTLWQNIDKYSS